MSYTDSLHTHTLTIMSSYYRTASSRPVTEQLRRQRMQQRNADYQKRRQDNRPEWIRRQDTAKMESVALERAQKTRRTENGDWITAKTGTRVHHSDKADNQHYIQGGNAFGLLDRHSEHDEPSVPKKEAFPALSKPIEAVTPNHTGWADVVTTDKPTNNNPPIPPPPPLKRSVVDVHRTDFSSPAKTCSPNPSLLLAPRKTLNPVRWGDDSDDDDDHVIHRPTELIWGDGAW